MRFRVSLAPKHVAIAPPIAPDAPAPLLDPHGAKVILGGARADSLVAPIVPGADTLFGPRGVCLAGPAGPLFVSDTGHHRLLVWRRIPQADGTPADLLIGQPDFGREGRNAKGPVGPATLNVPTGVAAGDGVLAVADAWNHRVLLWHGYPEGHNRGADIVLGQSDFTQNLANRGGDRPRADTLNWCYGVAIADGRLFVADAGNRRVLVWNAIPTRNGEPADLVLGQQDFFCRDENAGRGASAYGMRWPHAIACDGAALLVADAGNNRIMRWDALPQRDGAPCDAVLGQLRAEETDNNLGRYFPSARALNMPYGMAVADDRVLVADTANSRILAWDAADLSTGAAASRLAGQHSFADKGDNRWHTPARDSLCWPYGLATDGPRLAIADSGNNRVLLWDLAP
jgi:hypothetical protein